VILDQGPTPLYHQLKNILKSKILSHEFKGQEQLPSEAELCVEYNVSRATVRQALSELTKEGYVYRERGKGTFVTNAAGLRNLSLEGTIENLIASGRGSKIKLLDYKEIVPPPPIAKTLQLEKNQNVFQIEVIRSIPKGPFGYSLIYVPPRLGKTISRKELDESTEMITFIEQKSQTRAHRANQTIDVGLADQWVAKNLSIPPNSPVIIIERDYYEKGGAPMFVTITHFRPDLYKYRIELTRT